MGETGVTKGISSTWEERGGVGGSEGHGGATGEVVRSGVGTSTLRDVAGAGVGWFGLVVP